MTEEETTRTYLVQEDEEGERIDRFLAEKTNSLSRSRIQKLITEGHITVNRKIVKPNYKIKDRDLVKVILPPSAPLRLEPENIPLDIIYEDEGLIVVNKPRGMVVHPAPGNYSGTLVNALLYHCHDLSGINGMLRPGIVHRLDKDTTGLIVAAKSDMVHRELAKQLKERKIKRTYLALVHGNIKEDRGIIDAPLGRHPAERKKMTVLKSGGRTARTCYRVQERFGNYTLVRARLETGRTHQVRVHLAYIKHPVVGDPLYGPRKNNYGLKGQLLHAQELELYNPVKNEIMKFEAEPPQDFREFLRKIASRR